MRSRINLTATVPESLAFKRFDQAASVLFPEYSRSRIQDWIRSGELTADGKVLRPSTRLQGAEQLLVDATLQPLDVLPESIPLDVVYEDQQILVLNKPAGLVVHPGAGNWSGTMMNGLLALDPGLALVPRAGIVHRLDKGTTGLLVVARTIESQASLVEQLRLRDVKRKYEAVVIGHPERTGLVDAPIARHPRSRTRMAVRTDGKPALTHFSVTRYFDSHSHLSLSLETGRTHQIRVHMQHIGHSLVGDATYGARNVVVSGMTSEAGATLSGFSRPALHSAELAIVHPVSAEEMSWNAPLPPDFCALLDALDL